MNVRYRVELSQAERDELTALLSGGQHAARKLKRAQILLAADVGVSDEDIAISVTVGLVVMFVTGGKDVYYLSHPSSHNCLETRDCPMFK